MLHTKRKNHDARNAAVVEDVFAPTDLTAQMPKYKLPEFEHDPRQVYQLIVDELMLDGNARQNLASFCGTWEEPEVHHLLDVSLGKNMIDKDEYPQTAEIEARCVHILADLWHSPRAADTIGTSTTGSSEAAMLSGLALKWRWRRHRQTAGQSIERPNLVSGPVQVCWHKFARYFDVELREIPMKPGQYVAHPEDVLARCDDNTIGVVTTLGTTFTGHNEPVAAICAALDQYQTQTGRDIPVHVDAASGGFVAPFLDPDLVWDFTLPRVQSINASGHKYGLAPLGVGWVIWREKTSLPEDLVFRVNYLGGEMSTFGLSFSRPGGQVIAQYYKLLRLGREGYRKVMAGLRETAAYLADEIGGLGPFEILHDGREGLPVVAWALRPDVASGFNLFDLSNQLRTTGWQVPAYTLLPDISDLAVQRIVVRHGFDRDMAALFLNDLRRSVAYFDAHPVTASLQPEEAQSFNHS